MKEKTRVVGAVLGVLALIIVVSGITYAAFSWASDPDRGIISGNTQCFDITYTKGTDITNGSLDFGSTYTDGLSSTVKVKLDDACTINGIGTLYLDTKEETSDYLITNKLVRYQVLDGTTEVANGIIESKGKNTIYDNFDVTNTEKEFTVYIWISIEDVTDDNISSISSSTYSGTISMSAEGR